MATSWLGRSFCFFEELPSTNTYAKKLKADESLHGTVILADAQVAGRGQYQRNWYSAKEENLTFSIIFVPSQKDAITVLTLGCALAVMQALREICPEKECFIRWPNDIYLENKKVAGFLTETVFSGDSLERVVIGIGLNVNQSSWPEELKQSATSLQNEKGTIIDRELLLSDILSRIEYIYRLWQKNRAELAKKINKNMMGFGDWVQISIDNEIQPERFKLLGINEAGALQLLDENFDLHCFDHQQVRVVK